MSTYRVLLVEDDIENCEILQVYLSRSGKYDTTVRHDAPGAMQAVQGSSFDLILLDIVLPGVDGIELCAALRRLASCPVIFLSCLSDDETIVSAMRMGGDDYITKPFSCAVLEVHMEAVLRRAVQSASLDAEKLNIAGMTLCTVSRTLEKDGEVYFLSPTEYALLRYMMQNANRVLTPEELYSRVWMRPSCGDYRTVFVLIHSLRKKLESDPSKPKLLRTVPRGGYIFII